MTLEEFQRKLSILLGDAIHLSAGDMADELELQAQALRDSAPDEE